MIINLWSTPRTGSVWYSGKLLIDLRKQGLDAQLLTEPFNLFHLDMYKNPMPNGTTQNIHEYQHGCYYEEYLLTEDGAIDKTHIYGHRVRGIAEEQAYRLDLLSKCDSEKFPLVLHNHIMPLGDGIYDKLYNLADRNVYIHRRNLKEQLASYAVAYHTKVFAQFKPSDLSHVQDITVKAHVLEFLLDRIQHWDKLDKGNNEVIAYEDIDFMEHADRAGKLPIKQNPTPAFDRLSLETQNVILSLIESHVASTAA